MISIKKAGKNDSRLLSELATLSFIESHGRSGKPGDINQYISQKFSEQALREELFNEKNFYHIIYYNDVVAGFSNIIFNSPYPSSQIGNMAKLERIYLLKAFYDLKLGFTLLEYNVSLAKRNNQKAIWLFVWKENERAIKFYKRNGFEIIGDYDFKISDTHSNPNYQMLLDLGRVSSTGEENF